MGMCDNVKCEYPLPDTPEEIQTGPFQTKAFGDGFFGGFLENYTITKDGQLVLHKESWEIVPEEERPYYGKPEWNKNPLFQVMGSMKGVPQGDEFIEHHGIINIHADHRGNEQFEYEIKFTDGKVADIKRVYREFGEN